MIVASLLLILVAVTLLVLGLIAGSSLLLISSIVASLLAAVALVIGARHAAAARRVTTFTSGDDPVRARPAAARRADPVADDGPFLAPETFPDDAGLRLDDIDVADRQAAYDAGTRDAESSFAAGSTQRVHPEQGLYDDSVLYDDPVPGRVSSGQEAGPAGTESPSRTDDPPLIRTSDPLRAEVDDPSRSRADSPSQAEADGPSRSRADGPESLDDDLYQSRADDSGSPAAGLQQPRAGGSAAGRRAGGPASPVTGGVRPAAPAEADSAPSAGSGPVADEPPAGDAPGRRDHAEAVNMADEFDEPDPEDPDDEPLPQAVTPAAAVQVARLDAEVQVVDGRPRYHLSDCAHLVGRETEGLPVNEAVELGFSPCGLCRPVDRLVASAATRR